VYRYIEHLRRLRKDLEENLENYLRSLRDLARRYGGRVYVFGSYVRGERIGASDVDVLIEVPDSVNRLEVLHEARKLVPNRRVEIHVLNESDAQLFKKVIKYYREVG